MNIEATVRQPVGRSYIAYIMAVLAAVVGLQRSRVCVKCHDQGGKIVGAAFPEH